MESNGPRYDAAAARADLEDVEVVQRTVRDTPWPGWLYPVNAGLLALLALCMLLDDLVRVAGVLVVGAATGAVNARVGRRTGVPHAVPTSRAFRAGLVVAVLTILAAIVVALVDPSWRAPAVVGLAVATGAAYLVGSVPRLRAVS